MQLQDKQMKEINKFKNCAQIIDCISEINKQVDDAKDMDVMMPMYNLIKYINILIK